MIIMGVKSRPSEADSLERMVLKRMVELSKRITAKEEKIERVKQELHDLHPEKYPLIEEHWLFFKVAGKLSI